MLRSLPSEPSPSSQTPTLLSTEVVARRLGISERNVRLLAQRGVLPAIRVGKLWRFDAEALGAYMAGTPAPAPPATRPYHREPSGSGAPKHSQAGRGQRIVRRLLELGCPQKEIAYRTGVSATAISRLLSATLGPVSPALIARLEHSLLLLLYERLALIAATFRPKVLDTCNDTGTRVDDDVRSRIASAMLEGLDRPGTPLPQGFRGALMEIGQGTYLIRADDPRVVIHELEHLIARLRENLPDEGETPLPRPAF